MQEFEQISRTFIYVLVENGFLTHYHQDRAFGRTQGGFTNSPEEDAKHEKGVEKAQHAGGRRIKPAGEEGYEGDEKYYYHHNYYY